MSMSLEAGAVTIAHAGSNQDKQIFMAGEAIWGIKSDKLPRAKFDELKTVLLGHLTKEYWPYRVKSMPISSENVFMISMDPEVLETTYQKRPCSLDTCMVTNAAFICARCREAMYCSKEHQKADWSRHKLECILKQ